VIVATTTTSSACSIDGSAFHFTALVAAGLVSGGNVRLDADRLEAAERAEELLAEAEEKAAAAGEANQISDIYVLTGVLFALLLFVAGTSSKRKLSRNRSIMMLPAIVGLLAGILTVLSLPIQPAF
jgi:hypothetical protein